MRPLKSRGTNAGNERVNWMDTSPMKGARVRSVLVEMSQPNMTITSHDLHRQLFPLCKASQTRWKYSYRIKQRESTTPCQPTYQAVFLSNETRPAGSGSSKWKQNQDIPGKRHALKPHASHLVFVPLLEAPHFAALSSINRPSAQLHALTQTSSAA